MRHKSYYCWHLAICAFVHYLSHFKSISSFVRVSHSISKRNTKLKLISKASSNIWFSDIFRKYRNGTLGKNGLNRIDVLWSTHAFKLCNFKIAQQAFTCYKLKMEAPEQIVKSIQSYKNWNDAIFLNIVFDRDF